MQILPHKKKNLIVSQDFLFSPQGKCNPQNCTVRSLIPEPQGEIMVGLDHLMVRSAESAPAPCTPLFKGLVCMEPFAQKNVLQ